jgi:aspartyl-tRNA(Asn)/glutamyl-tRNA(Gln) amidotransferase subunit C
VKITETEVRYVADLAQLNLGEEEIRKLCADLSQILTYMEKLNPLDTSGVEPMAQVLYDAEETATLRDDTPHEPLGSQVALSNAALAGAGHFKVPKVIDR